MITKKHIAKLHNNNNNRTANTQLHRPKIANIRTDDGEGEYLAVLAPDKELNISIKPDSSLTTNDIGDSLVNYFWKSNMDFINKNSSFIFRTQNLDSIPLVFEKFAKERGSEINKFKNEISPQILGLLNFQNKARIYAFLFWLGRVSKELDPEHNYFDFVEKIPELAETLKSLPDIYLYKYEIEYLREHQSIENIPNFLKFIEGKTGNKDLADFLKAIYIRELIQSPSYWQKHEQLFNSKVLSEVLDSEKNNIYHYLIERPSSSFYASQNGEMAYLFDAKDKFGDNFNLQSLKRKVIFIDV